MITSCAPTPFIMSYMPMPFLFNSPSILSAGNLFGTTLTAHPLVFGEDKSGLIAKISAGVLSSFPGQKGQKDFFAISTGVVKSAGLDFLSFAIITHLPIMGSFLSSDIYLLFLFFPYCLLPYTAFNSIAIYSLGYDNYSVLRHIKLFAVRIIIIPDFHAQIISLFVNTVLNLVINKLSEFFS